MGETSGGNVGVLKDASLLMSIELTLVVPHLEKAPFVELCDDIVKGSDTPSIEHVDPICSELFDSTPISSALPPTTPSYMHAFHEYLGDLRGYNPSFDSYLEDVPQKIMWSSLIKLLIFL